jgi:L-threonylcarbamoyladenylate synthase
VDFERVQTEVLRIDPAAIVPETMARAAEVLRGGRLVAFPTETVYGLGANARDAAAVARIFAAKGRPSNNPLIVHLPEAAAAREIVAAWPESAERLAARFWPGPLTLVLPRGERIPAIVTAGGPTVAVRVPAHPVALALLRAAELPLAAPSANRSTQVSPTRAEHVLRGLRGRIEMILDGGPTAGGLESTVLDLTTAPPRLLRPGLIAPADLETVIGPIARTSELPVSGSRHPLPSPGMMTRHYAPRAPLELVEGDGEPRVQERLRQGERVGWLRLAASAEQPAGSVEDARLITSVMPRDPAAYAAMLYATLHALDEAGVTRLVVEAPPDAEEWLAVRDRLRRAASP